MLSLELLEVLTGGDVVLLGLTGSMLGLGFSLIAFIDVRLNLADQRRLIGVRLGGAFHGRPHRSIRPFCRAPSFPNFSLSSTPRCCGSKKISGVVPDGSERSSASASPRWATLTACAVIATLFQSAAVAVAVWAVLSVMC